MKIAVIGAGTMGSGIVQAFAQKGYDVIQSSHSIESANRGKAKLEKSIAGRVAKGKMAQEAADELLSHISVGDYAACAEADLIVEAIPEDIAKKKELWTKLDEICKEGCIFASNTSSISINELSSFVKKHSFIGMHFFNPAPVMKLIEVIPGLNTPQETIDAIIKLAQDIGKVPVEVKDNAGFVVNRILIPMINEACGLYAEGIASAEGIDNAMKLGANHPMGPLALGDFIGLDVCLAIMDVLYHESGDSKYRAHPLMRKMVRAGWLGVKSGKGFYDYNK